MITLAFYSASGNTQEFVDNTGLPATSIGASPYRDMTNPFIIVVPTYSAGNGRGAVPAPVRNFLNHGNNRSLIRGVIASGDRNFCATYCRSGIEIKRRFNVPVLHQFELRGNRSDVIRVREIVTTWN